MARPLRLEFLGAPQHLTSRGNARLPIYADNQDQEGFLATLSAAVNRFNWLCHAYCLMEESLPEDYWATCCTVLDGDVPVLCQGARAVRSRA